MRELTVLEQYGAFKADIVLFAIELKKRGYESIHALTEARRVAKMCMNNKKLDTKKYAKELEKYN